MAQNNGTVFIELLLKLFFKSVAQTQLEVVWGNQQKIYVATVNYL